MTLGVANYNLYCAAHTVERHGALDAIIALGQHTRSDDVWRGMPAWSLSSTHGRTTLSVAFHHLPWTAHTIGLRWVWHSIIALGQHTLRQRRAWHPIIALGKHTQLDDIGIACYHRF